MNSPIYAFFEQPQIVKMDGRVAHEFKCRKRGCMASVRRYLDKKDAKSTGNLRKHAKACWGSNIIDAADSAINPDEVLEIISSVLKGGSIAGAHKIKSKGRDSDTYSPHPHTREQDR